MNTNYVCDQDSRWCYQQATAAAANAGVQIEQPFSVLPLELFCATVRTNIIEQLQVRTSMKATGQPEHPKQHDIGELFQPDSFSRRFALSLVRMVCTCQFTHACRNQQYAYLCWPFM